MSDTGPGLRVDKWLWHARFFKTRTLAARMATGGKIRVNGTRISKASALVRAGDTLTFPQGSQIRVVEVADLGTRRGPASEAQALYSDKGSVDVVRPPRRGLKERRNTRLRRNGPGT